MEKISFINLKEQQLIDAILINKPTLNYNIIKTALRKRDVKINNEKVKENLIVNVGDKIELYIKNKSNKKIETIFEDENVLIVFKPAGIETTAKDKVYADSESLEELVKAKACHRLDKNTEGLVVLAKNIESENCLIDAFREQKIKKEYLAVVCGNINKNGEKLENYIKKEQNFVKICSKNDKNAKIAKLSYVPISSKNDLSMLKINLETGRTHQIRVQLSHHGIFVLGDEKYGDKYMNKKYHKTKQLLCSRKITFQALEEPLKYLSNKCFEKEPTFDFEKLFENKKI